MIEMAIQLSKCSFFEQRLTPLTGKSLGLLVTIFLKDDVITFNYHLTAMFSQPSFAERLFCFDIPLEKDT